MSWKKSMGNMVTPLYSFWQWVNYQSVMAVMNGIRKEHTILYTWCEGDFFGWEELNERNLERRGCRTNVKWMGVAEGGSDVHHQGLEGCVDVDRPVSRIFLGKARKRWGCQSTGREWWVGIRPKGGLTYLGLDNTFELEDILMREER